MRPEYDQQPYEEQGVYASQVHGVPPGPPPDQWEQEDQYWDEGPVMDAVEPEEEKPDKGRNVAHWVGLVVGCAVVGVLIGGAIVAFLALVNGPVTATAKVDPLEDARKKAEPTPSTNELAGVSIGFRYPAIFDTVGDQKTQAAVGDSYYITSKGNSSRAIAVAVMGLPSGKLDDDSSYTYRSVSRELYKETKLKLGEGTAVLMTKADNTEATLFWAHGGKDLNLSITSSDPHDNVPEIMQSIIPTIRWKK